MIEVIGEWFAIGAMATLIVICSLAFGYLVQMLAEYIEKGNKDK